ncbi:MAG: DUF5343 domain-containing protein [Bryobacteraceae bacterium]
MSASSIRTAHRKNVTSNSWTLRNPKVVLADAIREAYAELFAINKKANELSAKEASNKLRTLYAGKKTDLVIGNIAKTFYALCQYADFSDKEPRCLRPKRRMWRERRSPRRGQRAWPKTSRPRGRYLYQ